MPNPIYAWILNIYDLVCKGFHDISNSVGYLMPDPAYTFISNMIRKHISLLTFLNECELTFYNS